MFETFCCHLSFAKRVIVQSVWWRHLCKGVKVQVIYLHGFQNFSHESWIAVWICSCFYRFSVKTEFTQLDHFARWMTPIRITTKFSTSNWANHQNQTGGPGNYFFWPWESVRNYPTLEIFKWKHQLETRVMKFVDAMCCTLFESLIVNTVDFHSCIFEKNFQTISYTCFLLLVYSSHWSQEIVVHLAFHRLGGRQSSIAVKLRKSHIFVRSFLCSNSIGPPGSLSLTISLDTLFVCKCSCFSLDI